MFIRIARVISICLVQRTDLLMPRTILPCASHINIIKYSKTSINCTSFSKNMCFEYRWLLNVGWKKYRRLLQELSVLLSAYIKLLPVLKPHFYPVQRVSGLERFYYIILKTLANLECIQVYNLVLNIKHLSNGFFQLQSSSQINPVSTSLSFICNGVYLKPKIITESLNGMIIKPHYQSIRHRRSHVEIVAEWNDRLWERSRKLVFMETSSDTSSMLFSASCRLRTPGSAMRPCPWIQIRSSLAATRPGCLATRRPGRSSHRTAACSTPRRSWWPTGGDVGWS